MEPDEKGNKEQPGKDRYRSRAHSYATVALVFWVLAVLTPFVVAKVLHPDALTLITVWHYAALSYTALVILFDLATVERIEGPVACGLYVAVHILLIVAVLASMFMLFFFQNPNASVVIAFFILVLFSVVDLGVIRWGGISGYDKQVLARVFWIVDFPFSIASAILLMYLRFVGWQSEAEPFYVGAAVFQLLAQNALFAIVWGDFLPKLIERIVGTKGD